MKANARDIASATERPSPDIRLYLFHGPDQSTASEHARRIGKAMGVGAERIDMEGSGLRADPSRLADEAASLSLFGEARWIRVGNVGEESLEALTLLLDAERAGNPVVALAPTVKATAKIVRLATESRRAMAFACYEPSAADAEKIAVALVREAGLRPHGDVARRIAAAAGGDRAVIAREVEKLALYLDAAPDRPADLDEAALDAVGADLGEAEAGRLVEAVIGGDSTALGAELVRLAESGTAAIPWLRQLARRLMALAEMRVDLDGGAGFDAVIKRHRIFWREEAATRRALDRWNAAMLARGLDRVRRAERSVMAAANAGDVLAAHMAVEITRGVERRG